MSVDTLNKHVLRMLSHLNKYPIPDPQMVRDFKWFTKTYNLAVKSGEVTAPGGIVPNEVPTVIETILNLNGGVLSKVPTNNADGLEIVPSSSLRVYGVRILIDGTTSETFSYNDGGELDVSINIGEEVTIGQVLGEGDTPTGEGLTNTIYIFCDDNSISANDLSVLSVRIKIYSA
jgi:hypothetical protein